jgi:hypothetical protein
LGPVLRRSHLQLAFRTPLAGGSPFGIPPSGSITLGVRIVDTVTGQFGKADRKLSQPHRVGGNPATSPALGYPRETTFSKSSSSAFCASALDGEERQHSELSSSIAALTNRHN